MSAPHRPQISAMTSLKLRNAWKRECARLAEVLDSGRVRKITNINLLNGLVAVFLEITSEKERNKLAGEAVDLCGPWEVPQAGEVPENGDQHDQSTKARTTTGKALKGAFLPGKQKTTGKNKSGHTNNTPSGIR